MKWLQISQQTAVVTCPASLEMDPALAITSLCPGLCAAHSYSQPSPAWWDGCCFDGCLPVCNALCWWVPNSSVQCELRDSQCKRSTFLYGVEILMSQRVTLYPSHPPTTGWHSLCVDQGRAQSVFQTAAVHHSGQPSHPQLPGEKRRRTDWRSQRGGHRGQWEWVGCFFWWWGECETREEHCRRTWSARSATEKKHLT